LNPRWQTMDSRILMDSRQATGANVSSKSTLSILVYP